LKPPLKPPALGSSIAAPIFAFAVLVAVKHGNGERS